MSVNPSSVARQALQRLAADKVAPTPENYTRAYYEIAAPDTGARDIAPLDVLRGVAAELSARSDANRAACQSLAASIDSGDLKAAQATLLRLVDHGSSHWAALLKDALAQVEARTPGMTVARKREALQHLFAAYASVPDVLYRRVRGLVDGWAGVATGDPATGASVAPASGGIVAIASSVAVAAPGDAGAAAAALAAAPIVGRRKSDKGPLPPAADQPELQRALLRVIHALASNVAEMLADDPFLRGQFKALAELASGPLDLEQVASLERALREIVQKQGIIKKSVDEAKHALRLMTTTFVARLATLAADAGEHSERLDRYAMEIEHAEDIEELSDLVVQLAQDTRERQVDLTHVHDELVDTRRHAEEYEQRVERLERELAQLSDRLHEDQLTELLNRRGLDRQFDVELSRATRSGQPLSVCLIDIDDFKRINDTYGHQAGDRVLVHLSRLMRNSVRPADVVARYGGEEFVVLLPATHAAEAEVVMARVQRELTRHFFLHNNERVLVTFSAGVAEAAAGETAAVVLQRADEALYLAKERGKNRVMVRSAPAEGLAASDGTLDSEALARSAAE
jgi:diguanylate cyclase